MDIRIVEKLLSLDHLESSEKWWKKAWLSKYIIYLIVIWRTGRATLPCPPRSIMTKAEATLGGAREGTWCETSAPQPVLDLARQLPPPFLLVSGDPALRGGPGRWSLVPSWSPAARVTVLHASCSDVRMAGRRPQRVMTSAFRGRQGIWKISIKISRTSKAFKIHFTT